MSSWRTTTLGVLAILGAVLTQLTNALDNDPATTFDFDALLAGIAGLGLLFARDHKVTSEDAGAK